jgi:hypothetical protein
VFAKETSFGIDVKSAGAIFTVERVDVFFRIASNSTGIMLIFETQTDDLLDNSVEIGDCNLTNNVNGSESEVRSSK